MTRSTPIGRGRWTGGALALTAVVSLVSAGSAGFRSSGATTYVVRRGDTASAIAARFKIGVTALAIANALPDPNHILIGEQLTIPAPSAAPGGAGRNAPSATAADPRC
ncbi:MAG: LysM peptidoglycan-binding domain-containing protein, partial [Acidimicrobiales bacterium]